MGAIEEDPEKTRLPECIQCRTCADVCPQKAVSFPAVLSPGGEYSSSGPLPEGFSLLRGGGLVLGSGSTQTPFTPAQGNITSFGPRERCRRPNFCAPASAAGSA